MKIEKIRQRLMARRQELAGRVAQTGSDLQRNDEPLSADFDEQAVQLENDEVLQGINDSARLEIAQINHALSRVDSGAYFSCERCRQSIEAQRLDAVPYAVLCAECAGAQERKTRSLVT